MTYALELTTSISGNEQAYLFAAKNEPLFKILDIIIERLCAIILKHFHLPVFFINYLPSLLPISMAFPIMKTALNSDVFIAAWLSYFFYNGPFFVFLHQNMRKSAIF